MADNPKSHNDFDKDINALKRRIAELEKAEAELKEVERANHENEERYRLLAENISDVIWTMDKEFRFTYVTPSVKKLTGYDVEEILGRSLKSILTAESYELAMKLYKEALHLGKEKPDKKSLPRTLELSQKNKDGRVIITEARLTSVRDDKGEIIGFLGITRNITESKQAEIALHISEENYRTIFNSANDAMIIHDYENGRFLDVNQKMCEMFGYSQQEALGLSTMDIVSETEKKSSGIYTPEQFTKIWQQFRDKAHVMEWHAKNKIGQDFWVELSMKPMEIGRVKRVLAIVRDITERRQALEAVKKSELQLRQFIEDAGEPMMSVDNEGRIIFASKRVANYLGLRMDEVVGKTLWDAFARDFADSGITEMKEAVENKKRFSREYQVVFNGDRKWYEIIVQPLALVQGIDQAAQVIAHDVTEAIKANIRDRARIRLLNNLRSVNDIDKCLECGCRAIKDSQHYRRAVMTLHNEQREIVNLGHIGLDMAIVDQARNGRAPDEKVRRSIMQDKYRISRSYFIPAEANLQLDKSERYVPPDTNQNGLGQAWKNGDEFFIPILSDNNECEGWLSVDTPYDDRRPNIVTALFLEEIVDIVTKKIHEISSFQNLQGKSQALEESNIALRTVLANIEHDKAEIRGKVSQFINDIILPAVDRLVNTDGSINKIQYTALKNGLFELISAPDISMQSYPQLSPRELEIGMMIKDGFNSKEISKSLHIALKTVHKHRQFIRQKLGIDKQKINLTTYLGNNQIYRQQ